MRKGVLLLLIAIAGTLVSAPTQADAQVRPWQISIVGGPTFPVGEFRDDANTGYHVQGSVGFPLGMFPLTLRADLLWQEVPEVHEGWFRQIGGLLNATFGVATAQVRPYGLVGAGYVRTEAPEHEGGGSENNVGLNVGLGVDFPFMGLSGVLEGRYLNVAGGGSATELRTIPVSIGIKF